MVQYGVSSCYGFTCPFNGPFCFQFGAQLPVELCYGGGFCDQHEFGCLLSALSFPSISICPGAHETSIFALQFLSRNDNAASMNPCDIMPRPGSRTSRVVGQSTLGVDYQSFWGCATPQGVGHICRIDGRIDGELHISIL